MDIEGFAMMTLERLPFEPTDQQIKLVAALARFCSLYKPMDTVFILTVTPGRAKHR